MSRPSVSQASPQQQQQQQQQVRKKGLWPEETELIALFKQRREIKLHNQTKSVSTVTAAVSVKSVAKSLQSQKQQQKAKTKGVHPKHRLRRRQSHTEAAEAVAEAAPTTTPCKASTPAPAAGTPPPKTSAATAAAADPVSDQVPSTMSTPPLASSPRASPGMPGASPKVMNVFDDDGRLLQKIRRINTAHLDVETLVTPETLLTGDRFSVPALVAAKERLTLAKDRLDPIVEKHGRDAWAKHTAALNPSGQVVRHLRHQAQVEMGTNSWTKMWEILCAVQDCVNAGAEDRGIVRSLHLCEAPGAFVCATNQFVKTRMREGTAFEWHASTLNPRAPVNEGLWMICDDKFMRHTRSHWLFGKDDTGQLMQVENIRDIWQRLGDHKVDLVTADGSLDSSHAPNDQEDIASPLVFCEVVCALGALRPQGTLVLKVFTLLEHQSVGIMAILGSVFEELVVTKPFTARHGNGELYVVALRFRGISPTMLERLLDHCKPDLPLDKALLPLKAIPPDFTTALVEASEYFASQQEQAISGNLTLWHNFDPVHRDEVQRIRRLVADQFMIDFGVQTLPNEKRLVQSEHVDGARQPGQPFGPVHSSRGSAGVRHDSRRSLPHAHGRQPRHSGDFGGGDPTTPPSKRLRVGDQHSPSQRMSEAYSPVVLPQSAGSEDSHSSRSTSMSPPVHHLPQQLQLQQQQQQGPLPFPWAVPKPSRIQHLQSIASEILGMPFAQLAEGLLGTSLRMHHLQHINSKEYTVSWLPEAPLSLLFILHEGVYVMPLDASYPPIPIPNLAFPKRKAPNSTVGRTIACGHLVVDKVERELIPRFLISDLLAFEAYHLRTETHSLRQQIAKVELVNPLKQRIAETGVRLPISVRVMNMFPLSHVQSVLSILRTLTHEASGLTLFHKVARDAASSSFSGNGAGSVEAVLPGDLPAMRYTKLLEAPQTGKDQVPDDELMRLLAGDQPLETGPLRQPQQQHQPELASASPH